MKLSPRLKLISSLVKNTKIADIGTDHALILIDLLRKKKIKSAIATDINSNPLEIAKNNCQCWNLNNKIDFRIGFGLKPLKFKEVSEIIIAGMGGELIISILKNDLSLAKSLKRIILQPMSKIAEVRFFLLKTQFNILEEYLIKEKKHFYEILVVSALNYHYIEYNNLELKYGIFNLKNPLLKEKLLKEKNFLEKILNILKLKNNKNVLNRKKEIEKKIIELERIIFNI